MGKLTLVRFRRGHAGNTAFLMAQDGASFDKHYYLIGHVAQNPRRILLMLAAQDQPARTYQVDRDRIEPVPEEDVNA